MMGFIVPLRSQQVSNSWDRVSQLFERTLKSICNQTSSAFQVFVVCHEKPKIAFDSPKVTYIEVDFPAPTRDRKAKFRDKNRKILKGLIHAQALNCSHAMVVDSDDLISRDIAKFVTQNTHKNGWFVGSGYEYEEGSNFIKIRRRNLYQKTGTSNIIKLDLLESDTKVDSENVDCYFLHHQKIVDLMRQRGTPLELLPFDGTVYVTETGENNWAQKELFWQRKITLKALVKFYLGKMYKIFITRPLDASIQHEFGIYNLSSELSARENEILLSEE